MIQQLNEWLFWNFVYFKEKKIEKKLDKKKAGKWWDCVLSRGEMFNWISTFELHIDHNNDSGKQIFVILPKTIKKC